jgi:hypothetical protein
MRMRLENKIMRGNVFYLQRLRREGDALTLDFLGDPNQNAIVRRVVFSAVQNWREEYYERDVDAIEMLIGVDESPEETGVEYMLHTDQREIWFFTPNEPNIWDMHEVF